MNLLDKKKNIQSKNSINIEKEKKVEHIVASTKFKKKKRNLLDKNKIISELEKYLNEFNLWILHLLKQIKNYKYTKFVFLKIQNNKYVQKLASKTKKNKHVRKTYFYWKKQNVFVRTFSAATVIIMLVYLCVTPFIPFLTSGKSIENNTDISYSNNSNNTLYENTNPNFTVGFGDKTNPTEQRVVFAAKPAEKSGFIQAKDSSVFDKIGDYVFGVPEKSVEMKFSSAEFNENLEQSIYDVVKSQIPEEKTELAKKNIAKVVAANRDIKTSTKLIKNDAESKQDKIVNPSIAPDTDIEYQVIKGEGIKENIVINQSDSFQKECVKSLLDESGNVKCNVPKNRYVFDMKLDENIKLHVLNQALDDLPVGTFFFTDEKDKYLFHILPPVAEDAAKKKTTDIKYNVEKVNDREYKFYVTISLNWLLSNDRVYPVKIDPTIVHNTKASFDTGSLNRAESLDGPKVQTAGNEMLVDRNTMGLWHMNEASGTSVGDSANGNTGTAANAATVVSGIYGNGRSFNGTSDKITVAQSNSLTTVKQISIEAWIKPSGSAAQPIVEYGDAIRFGVHMWQYDGSGGTNHFSTLFCNFVGIYTSGIDHRMIWSPPGSIVAGNWYHVACVYDEYYAKLYINGKEVASQYFSGDIALYTALPLNIGYRPAGGNYFNGTIDEVKISNNARSADEIKADAQRRPYSVYTSPIMDLGADTSSLNSLNWTQKGVRMGSIDTPMDSNSKVAQWPMNETSGTTMTMTSGSCGAPCNGTLYGFANTSGQDVAAYSGWTSNNTKDNGSLMFDGVDDYVNVTTNSSINFTGDMSTEFWVNPGATQSNSYATIFSRHGTGTAGYTLEQNNANSNQYYFSWGNGTAWACNTETLITLSPNVWQYVAISKSGSTVTAYVNGVLNGTCTGTFSVIASNSLNLKIGQSSTNAGRFFKGMLDSMRFYSRALTVDEIITNYGATNIGFETRTGTTATPDSTDLSDGTNWEKWKSVTDSGTSLETNISDSESTTLYNTTDTGLQSYWPMDESANSNSCNSGTYDYCDIVGTNGATGSTTKPKINDGVYGNSRGFDGSSSFASVTSSSSISPTSALTVEGWFKPAKTFDNTADYNQGIVDKGDYQFFLDKTDGKAKWVVNDNTAKAFSALGSGASSTVVALTTWKGALYAAGYFTSIGTCVSGCSYVAKWDGSTWTALSTGLNNVARVLEVYNGNLYAGGDFTTAGTCITNCTYLAKWDGTTWSAVGVPLNGVVISLAVMNGVLYVGGSFVNAGGISVNRIAQWNGTSWSALGGGANGPVNALTIWNGNLYAGGNFTIIGGVTVYYIAKWNG
ncbi:MAG: LamG-like jellyroll fold domain-containing protein, partial [bacterium]